MNPMGEQIKTMSTTSENMTYLVDKKNVCQHNRLNQLTDRRRKWISETMYRYIEKSFNNIHKIYITSEGGDNLSNQKLNNGEI